MRTRGTPMTSETSIWAWVEIRRAVFKTLLVDEFGEFHYLSIWRFPKSGWNPQIIQVMDDHSNPHIMRMGLNSGTPKIGWFRFQNVWLGLKIRSL